MKPGGLKYGWLLAAVSLIIVAANNRAQQLPIGHANGFMTDMYFEPPNEQQVKLRLSGAEASPLPGGLLDVKQLKVESFSTNGLAQLVAVAPQCTYAPFDNEASSGGHLELRYGDGKFRCEGDGFRFVYRANETTLTLSNHVHTVIEAGLMKP